LEVIHAYGGVTNRRKYDLGFKLEAVRLVTDGGRRVVEVAGDLGIHENLLYNWSREISG
jgi:transposase-like protein